MSCRPPEQMYSSPCPPHLRHQYSSVRFRPATPFFNTWYPTATDVRRVHLPNMNCFLESPVLSLQGSLGRSMPYDTNHNIIGIPQLVRLWQLDFNLRLGLWHFLGPSCPGIRRFWYRCDLWRGMPFPSRMIVCKSTHQIYLQRFLWQGRNE